MSCRARTNTSKKGSSLKARSDGNRAPRFFTLRQAKWRCVFFSPPRRRRPFGGPSSCLLRKRDSSCEDRGGSQIDLPPHTSERARGKCRSPEQSNSLRKKSDLIDRAGTREAKVGFWRDFLRNKASARKPNRRRIVLAGIGLYEYTRDATMPPIPPAPGGESGRRGFRVPFLLARTTFHVVGPNKGQAFFSFLCPFFFVIAVKNIRMLTKKHVRIPCFRRTNPFRAGCGSSVAEKTSAPAAPGPYSGAGSNFSRSCPARIVAEICWYPRPEHHHGRLREPPPMINGLSRNGS